MTGLSFTPKVSLFDANIAIGHTRDAWSIAATSEDLLAEMARHGVERALVRHAYAETGSPEVGHEVLSELVAGHDSLVMQACAYGTDESRGFLASLHETGKLTSVRLAKFREPNIPFTPVFYGDLLEWMQERSVPLFIPIHEVDVRDIGPTLNRYPDLDAVLLEAHYVDYFYVRPLMRAAPRLHLELSRYEAMGEIEDLLGEFGAERLIYGSAYPMLGMGPVSYFLHHCQFTDDELALVCAGNLDRLLAVARTA